MSCEWTIVYHGGGEFKGRGEFLRLMFEDKGVPYEYSDANMYGPEGTMCCFRGSAEKIREVDNTVFPVFYPPVIHHKPQDGGGEEVMINQVAACMQYIGNALGYAPSSPAEKARADCIFLNACDYVSEGRSSFHPVNNLASYKDQVEEGDKVSKEWSKTRMQLWLTFFDKICTKTTSLAIAGGADLTYADFALFHALDATVAQFENEKYENAWTHTDVPALKTYYEQIKSRPNLHAYLTSDRCAKFMGDSMM